MNFKKYFILCELNQEYFNKLPNDVKKLLDDKKLPFNEIFGNKLRLAEKLNGGIKYELKIKEHINEYDFDFPSWMGYKKTDLTKKNPIRIGKILSKQKSQLEQSLKNNTLDAQQISQIKYKIEQIDELLKTTNLQKQYENANKSGLYVIYSRAPVDVVRMSDFDWSSCHSPGNDYFHCALADAMIKAGIAYLIKEEEFNKIKDLQEDEIFSDRNRSVEGVRPLARIRIRALIDTKGNTLAVPITKIYGMPDYKMNNDFIEQTIDWAKRQNTSNFSWEDVLQITGGSYEDYGYEIEKQVKKIWGKDISVEWNTSEEEEFRDDEEEDDEHQQEQFYDDCRDEIDDEKIIEKIIGGDGDSDICDISLDFDHYQEAIPELQIRLPRTIHKIILEHLKEKGEEIKGNETKTISREGCAGCSAIISVDFTDVSLESDSYVCVTDYAEYYGHGEGGHFRKEQLYSRIDNLLTAKLKEFTEDNFYFDNTKHDLADMCSAVSNAVLKILGISPIQIADPEITQGIIDEYIDKNSYLFSIQLPNNKNYWIDMNNPNKQHKKLYQAMEMYYWKIADDIGNHLLKKYKIDEKAEKKIRIAVKCSIPNFSDYDGKTVDGIPFFKSGYIHGYYSGYKKEGEDEPRMIISLTIDDYNDLYAIAHAEGLESLHKKLHAFENSDDVKEIQKYWQDKFDKWLEQWEIVNSGQKELDLSSFNRLYFKLIA